MRYSGDMLSVFRSLFHHDPPAPPVAHAASTRRLGAGQDTEFFGWFHLGPDGEPVAEGDDIRHRFRPLGDAFRALVVVDVIANAADGIRSAHLCLDRSFVSGPDEAFARDIAQGFLGWILDEEAQERAAPLIANIGNFAAAAGPVITAGELPQPPADTSGGYAVFTGDGDAAALLFDTATLTLANIDGRLTIEAVLE